MNPLQSKKKEEVDEAALYGRLVDFVIDFADILRKIEERKRSKHRAKLVAPEAPPQS